MYNPGGEYLTYIKNSLVRKPRAKVVVDGNTYTGIEHLASFPKITHETEKMIGGFPAKTCSFEIYNLDGTIDLNGKEVQIYRGLCVSNTKTVWVPMGLFYADGEDVTNNSTKRTIQFKGTDRTRLFESPFAKVYSNGVVPADTLVSSVAEKICQRHGLTVDLATKANIISYRFAENVGTPESTTDRQMIAWIAELSGCIPIISRDGQSLEFTRPTYKDNGIFADKKTYKTLSAEPLYGPINAISFGHADYDDAYVYQDDLDVEANGLHEWQINDNPLVEQTVAKTELAPKVLNIIKGMKLYPFTLTDFIDDFLFDINDGILIKKKDGTLITTYVLGMSTTSRIRSTFKANTQDSSAADRSLAGSIKADMKRVKLSVDHINNEITALAKESEEKFAQLTLTTKGLYADIHDAENGLKAAMTATAEKAESAFEKATAVENAGYITTEDAKTLISQSADNITLSIEKNLKIGARNILLDSACFKTFTPTQQRTTASPVVLHMDGATTPSGEYKAIAWRKTTSADSGGVMFNSIDILGQAENAIKKVKAGTKYTLSFWVKAEDGTSDFSLVKSDVIYTGKGVTYDDDRSVYVKDTNGNIAVTADEWRKVVLVFTINSGFSATSGAFCVRFLSKATAKVSLDISSLKLEAGNVATDWSPSSEDIDQSVKAQISMCVQKDENNKLTSAIAIEGNKISIKSDNFELSENGTVTKCTGAKITDGTIVCGEDGFNMTIAAGAISHTMFDESIGGIGGALVSLDWYELIHATNGIDLSVDGGCMLLLNKTSLELYDTTTDTPDLWWKASKGKIAIHGQTTMTIGDTTEWSAGAYSAALRSILTSNVSLVINASDSKHYYPIYLCGESIVFLGKLFFDNYKGHGTGEGTLKVNFETGEIYAG